MGNGDSTKPNAPQGNQGKTPSHIATLIIKGPDNKTYSGVVYVDHTKTLYWMLYEGDETLEAKPYQLQRPITLGNMQLKASKVTAVSYHDSKPVGDTANQIRIYYMTLPENNQPIKLKELVLKADGTSRSFFGQSWTSGDNGNPTFDRDITDNIHPHSPLSAKVSGGKIRVWYRRADTDALRVAWNDPNGSSSNKVWSSREAFSTWPL